MSRSMSNFTPSTYADAKTAGAKVIAVVAGLANNQIPVGDFAANSDVEAINGKIPSGASSLNKLATASDVTASIGKVNDGGALTDGATVSVPNNAVSTLSSSQSALTLNVELEAGEIPNFAVEITAGAAITLTVTKTVSSTTTVLKYSEAAGNDLESGKFYQVTCVGNCWTLAEFTSPS